MAVGVREARVYRGRTPPDFHRTAVRNFESVYRRYAIVSEADLTAAARRLDSAAATISGTIGSKARDSQ